MVASARQQFQQRALDGFIVGGRQNAAAERNRRVAGNHDIALTALHRRCLLDREPHRVGARQLCRPWRFVDRGGYDPVGRRPDPRQQIAAARARRRENQAHRARWLFEAIGDPALGQIIRGQFDQHLIADQNADAILAHLAGGVAENFVDRFPASRGTWHWGEAPPPVRAFPAILLSASAVLKKISGCRKGRVALTLEVEKGKLRRLRGFTVGMRRGSAVALLSQPCL